MQQQLRTHEWCTASSDSSSRMPSASSNADGGLSGCVPDPAAAAAGVCAAWAGVALVDMEAYVVPVLRACLAPRCPLLPPASHSGGGAGCVPACAPAACSLGAGPCAVEPCTTLRGASRVVPPLLALPTPRIPAVACAGDSVILLHCMCGRRMVLGGGLGLQFAGVSLGGLLSARWAGVCWCWLQSVPNLEKRNAASFTRNCS